MICSGGHANHTHQLTRQIVPAVQGQDHDVKAAPVEGCEEGLTAGHLREPAFLIGQGVPGDPPVRRIGVGNEDLDAALPGTPSGLALTEVYHPALVGRWRRLAAQRPLNGLEDDAGVGRLGDKVQIAGLAQTAPRADVVDLTKMHQGELGRAPVGQNQRGKGPGIDRMAVGTEQDQMERLRLLPPLVEVCGGGERVITGGDLDPPAVQELRQVRPAWVVRRHHQGTPFRCGGWRLGLRRRVRDRLQT